jgi:Cytochrome P450
LFHDHRYLSTRTNREINRLNQEIRSLIQNIVEEHKQQTSLNQDFLHSIIKGSESIPDKSVSIDDFIIDNCKTMYLAGLETTSVSLTWCLLLLSVYPEWQDRVRKEVLEVTHGAMPDLDMLSQFKMVCNSFFSKAIVIFFILTRIREEKIFNMYWHKEVIHCYVYQRLKKTLLVASIAPSLAFSN